ncbi:MULTISPECIES: hypothetical protein [Stenotrophomonas]|jgi:uncharacterized membrane protein YgcG|uniref:hypothetical protein n=1 Tax=Stenotrophomonas TaxID=40323 RepID=UPI00030B4700|nr:hypothetical protein [Stenotrophomonas sp. BIO128-Bstrain]WIA60914.1 hypothetical protein POS15_16410 [Stenotrophomonas sp. BIO128-Bstrain]
MRGLDFTSWQAMLSTLAGLAIITLIGVGIRLLVMQTMQQRRERENRQINERLRTLIAAYKVLGGSFTGTLDVDPRHRRDFRALPDGSEAGDALHLPAEAENGGERARRIRDAVEAALSDIVLLGTDEQVRLAAHAANEMAQGRLVPTAELVVSLRDFIRQALDLDPIPASVTIPRQGPARPSAGAKGKGDAGDKGGGKGGGGGGMGGGGGGGMGGMGGAGMGGGAEDAADTHR